MGKELEWKRLWHPTISLLCKVYISLSTFYARLVEKSPQGVMVWSCQLTNFDTHPRNRRFDCTDCGIETGQHLYGYNLQRLRQNRTHAH